MSDQDNMGDHGDNPVHAPPDIGANEVEAPAEEGNEDTHMSEHSESEREDNDGQRTDVAQTQVPHGLGSIPAHHPETTPDNDSGQVINDDMEDSQGHEVGHEQGTIDDNLEDATEDEFDADQDEIMQTVEEELFGLEPGAFDPDNDMYDEEEDLQQQMENDVHMAETDIQPDMAGQGLNGEFQERDDSAESTPSDQTLQPQSEHDDQPDPAGFSLINNGVDENDASSLFVSEESLAPPRLPARQHALSNIPAPARPTPQPRTPGNSMFAKIRNMQKAHADKKIAAERRANAHRHIPEPDNEAYLEAIMSPITAPPTMREPQVSKEDRDAEEAREKFLIQQEHYAKLKRENGHLTFLQDVEWLKIRGAEDSRRAKLERDRAKAREDGEEADDGPLLPGTYPSYDGDQIDDDEESDSDFHQLSSSSRKRARRQMPRKEPKQRSMQDAELESMRVMLDADADIPKRKKKKTQDDQNDVRTPRSGGKSKGKSTRAKGPKSKTAPKAAKKPRNTAKAQRARADTLRQATSLFNADVFEQQAGPDAREQPTFRARTKQDALKELIASVPLEEKKQVRTDMSSIIAATRDFDGHGSVKPVGGNWLVKGMKTSLKGYQVLGSSFLRRRENATEAPRGGLMADQMGLGKTLMMLANIVNGRPKKGQQPRTTLLVASPALITQWAREIEAHTNCGFTIMKYGCGNRVDSNTAAHVLLSHDFILTTYHEVMKSYPKNEPPIECQTAQQKIAWWKETYEQRRGILHRMQFLRVVLDEAQTIKNHLSRTSIACRALMAEHKWAMSGTPVLNGLSELYPYFKFLGVPHTGSFKIFKHNYCDSRDGENTERLLSRLAVFMIRRTHADQLFNAPILKLPQAAQSTYWCDFNPIERTIYDIVHNRFASKINQWQANGELEKSYSNALVMLLRLRQLSAHVLMLQFVMRDLLEVEDIERINEVVKDQSADSTTQNGRTIIAIRKQLEKHAIEEKKRAKAKAAFAAAKAKAIAEGKDWVDPDEEAEVEDEAEPEPELDDEEFTGQRTAVEGARLGGSGKQFGKDYNFKPFLASLRTGENWEKAKKRATCGFCGKPPRQPYITSCGHLICSEPCMEISMIEAAEEEKEYSPCKACGRTPTSWQMFDPDGDFSETVADGTRSKAKQKNTKQRERRDREDISEDWLSLAGAEVLPSAKTLAIKAQILNWTKENPKVKIIIYTQFLAMVRILGKICQQEGWQAEQYIGTMSFGARDKAISKFADDPKCNILLASLRCGGLGLNLTMASRVIMVDPWWNEASEQQAFCRVFRIGQKDETFMSRLCVRNTVDYKLIKMQDRKNAEINEVMEDDGRRLRKLTSADLMRLFGNLNDDGEDDPEGRQFIMVDNPDPQGGFRADRDDEGYADEM